MQILVPISGHSVFFPREEYFFTKPLVEVANAPMSDLVARQLRWSFPMADFVAVVDRREIVEFSLDRILAQALGGRVTVIERPGPTRGALCSCLLAVDVLRPDEPIIVVNSDQVIDTDLQGVADRFRDAGVAAGVITFPSSHPRWSYVTIDGDDVVQATEKQVISREAIAGFYYFENSETFVEAAARAVAAGAQSDGDYFISAAVNEVILGGGRVAREKISSSNYHSFYSPAKIEEFERTPFSAKLRRRLSAEPVSVNVVVPAGGEGSRFENSGWKKPKPFLDVDGEMMLARVLRNVRTVNGTETVLLRGEHLAKYPQARSSIAAMGVSIEIVDRLTEGTATTVLLARDRVDSGDPLLIANSDQLVDFDVDDFVSDCIERDLDGSILVFRDPDLNPKWSFARVDGEGLVVEVAEKRPISDLATVGIYLFRRGSDFVDAAVDMIARNDRVNGEFYTAPTYNYLIARGKRIGVYEVAADAMHGLGVPDDLNSYLDSIGAPRSPDAPDEYFR